MRVRKPSEHNLVCDEVRVPLGLLVGVCGVSGSGKSTLVLDTIGRALAPPRVTTSVSTEPHEPGVHEAIEGAPARTIVADQARAHLTSPGAYLGVIAALRRAFADTDAVRSGAVRKEDLLRNCDTCAGRGVVRERMEFLPTVAYPCEVCDGTGYTSGTREVRVRGVALHEAEALTLAEISEVFADVPAVARAGRAAERLGIGYLVVRQPSWTLSGGEAQRVKLAKELARPASASALYLLDEPTVGLHATEVEQLVGTLDELVSDGHTVVVVEHEPRLLACCDWLVELGPGGGPDGGRVVATGTPEDIAVASTATAPFLEAVLA
jgi:excinuclease ABC subunit A